MSDESKALALLTVLADTCAASRTALEKPQPEPGATPPPTPPAAPAGAGAAGAPPELDTLRRDYASLLTLVYTSATKVALALRPSEPAYAAAAPQLTDLSRHVSSLTTCASLFDLHGLTLARSARRLASAVLETVRALAGSLARREHPLSKDYLVRTGAVHEAVELARKNLPWSNAAAVQVQLAKDRELLKDCFDEMQDMVKEEGDDDDDDDDEDEDEWADDDLEDLGFRAKKPLSDAEFERAKLCAKLLQWSCNLHRKIIRDLKSNLFSDLPPTSLDVLPRHSHSLLIASEDLVTSLYAPQDLSNVRAAVKSVERTFRSFKISLFPSEEDNIVDRLSEVTLEGATQLKESSLPHGYDTSYDVLEKLIDQMLDSTKEA